MILIENGLQVFNSTGSEVELWVPVDVEQDLKDWFLVEMLQGHRQLIAEDFVYMRLCMESNKVQMLMTAMLHCMFDTQFINLN